MICFVGVSVDVIQSLVESHFEAGPVHHAVVAHWSQTLTPISDPCDIFTG